MAITIKVSGFCTIRRLEVEENLSLSALRDLLEKHFPAAVAFHINYKDEDGDDIAFSTDEELRAQILASKIGTPTPLRLSLTPIVNIPDSTSSPDNGQVCQLITEVSKLVEVLSRGRSISPSPNPRPTKLVRTEKNQRGSDANQERVKLRDVFMVYPVDKPKLRLALKSVQPTTRKAFQRLCGAVRRSANGKMAVDVLKNSSVVKLWLAENIDGDACPSEDSVKKLVCIIGAALCNVDKKLVDSFSKFAVLALQDKAFVSCVAYAAETMDPKEKQGSIPAVCGNAGKGFKTFNGTKCDMCGVSPIVGELYMNVSNKKNVICNACFLRIDVHSDTHESYKKCEYVWEYVFPKANVPPPTLKVGSRGAKVKFLHKLLTDLGYMNRSMYAKRSGLFSLETKKCLETFQLENGISDDHGEYKRATAVGLEKILKERTGDGIQIPPPIIDTGDAGAMVDVTDMDAMA